MSTNETWKCLKCNALMERPIYCLVHGRMCPICGAGEDHLIMVQRVSSD